MSSVPGPPPPLLGAYAALRCARRISNDFDSTIATQSGSVEFSPEVQGRIDAGVEFDAAVRERLRELGGNNTVDITERGLFGPNAIAATVQAMQEGALTILGGQLPDDVEGGRVGKPDVLVRFTQAQAATHTYVPVDIKRHKTLSDSRESSPPALISTLTAPALQDAIAIAAVTTRKQERDAMQLAHYWRMLQSAGWAPAIDAIGGIIGTDELDGDLVIVWRDLEDPIFRTFSRSSADGFALRSAMQRYDHEFLFRSQVAASARQRVGAPTDPEPVVVPVFVKECAECPWHDYCRELLGDADASVQVGRLSTREWLTLRKLGYAQVEQLAALDLETIESAATATPASQRTQELLAAYLPEVTGIQSPRRRLRDAVMTAQMVQDGTDLRRITRGPIAIPRADVEIDFDIENDRDAHVYLWGMLITDHTDATTHFEHVTSWDELDAASEAAVASEFWSRLTAIIAAARDEGKSVRIYHYSTPEPSNLRRIALEAAHPDLPSLEEVDKLIEETFTDMYPIMRANFFGRDGLGLKVVATRGAGFAWRDEDPGGLQSITWLEQVRAGDHDSKQRILEYNEDDVRATLALRQWLAD